MIYASKAFPCTAAYRLFAEEGLSADVASGGELHLALAGGFEPERIYFHGNNKTPGRARLRARGRRRAHRGRLVRRDRAAARARPRACCCGSRPASSPSTHSYIQTGQEDSKFGFGLDDVPRAVAACADAGLELRRPARAHRLAGLRARGLRAAGRGARRDGRVAAAEPRRRASASPTRARSGRPRSRSTSRRCSAGAPRRRDGAVRAGPLAGGQRRRDDLHGGHREAHPGRPHLRRRGRRHVRQPAADALRRPLRGRDRRPLRRRRRRSRSPACTASPATSWCATRCSTTRGPGDVLVTPATGAYGHAMANNYNARAAPAGDLLQGRRRARGRAARDLRRSDAP